jgi:hypothetical protein
MTIWRPAPRHQRSYLRPGDFTRPGRLFALCSIRSLTRPLPGPNPSQPHGPRARVCHPALAPCPFVRITHRASRTGPRDPGQPARPAHAPPRAGRLICPNHASRIPRRAARPRPACPAGPCPPSGGASYLSESRITHPTPGRATSASLPGQPVPPSGDTVLFVRIAQSARPKRGSGRWPSRRRPDPEKPDKPLGPQRGAAPCGSALTPAARRRRAGRG